MGTPRARLPRGLSIIVLVLLFFMDSPGMQSAEAITCSEFAIRLKQVIRLHNSRRPTCPPTNPRICEAYDKDAIKIRIIRHQFNLLCVSAPQPYPPPETRQNPQDPRKQPVKPEIDSYAAVEKIFTRYPLSKLNKDVYLTGSKQEMEKVIQKLTQGRVPDITYKEEGTVLTYQLGDGSKINVRNFSTSGGRGDLTVDLANPKKGKRNLKLHIGP